MLHLFFSIHFYIEVNICCKYNMVLGVIFIYYLMGRWLDLDVLGVNMIIIPWNRMRTCLINTLHILSVLWITTISLALQSLSSLFTSCALLTFMRYVLCISISSLYLVYFSSSWSVLCITSCLSLFLYQV